MQIPNTWDDVEQPPDDETAGNTWFWRTTYREFHTGLKLALEELKSYSELAAELQLKSSPYQSEFDRLQGMVDWGEERLKTTGTSTLAKITLQGVPYGSLRYLKAGILMRAQKTAEKKEPLVHSHRFVPKTILQTFDEKIAQLLNLAEQGLLKGLRSAELLFESVPDDANEKMVPEGRIQSSVTKVAYGFDQPTVIDATLRERCLSILNSIDQKGLAHQFDTVIREMSVVLEDRVRALSGCSENLSGGALFSAAMAGKKPLIKFSDRKDLQENAHLLFRGYSGFVRNEVMHKLVASYTRERVVQLLGMVDYLLDLLSSASGASNPAP